jgi:predicted ATPase
MPASGNQGFYHKIRRGTTSHFFPYDLHVHTPGSQDITTAERHAALPAGMQSALPVGTAMEKGPLLGEYDKAAEQKFSPEAFYDLLNKQRTSVLTDLGWDNTDALCVIGLTDHNVFGYSCKVAKLAWDRFKERRILILPGVELDVSFPVPGTNERTRIHLLCHFSPTKAEHDIHQAITVANGNQSWAPGSEVVVDDLPVFVNNLRNSKTHPAMCVAAHVSSSSGIQREVTTTVRDFTRQDVATVAKASTSAPATLSEEKLRSMWAEFPEGASMGASLSTEHAALLSLLGKCGFDGLQVTSKLDETHYRSLHRIGADRGRSIPLIASDAHSPINIFLCNGQVPFIKLPVSLAGNTDADQVFRIIRDESIRFGETRTTFCAPEKGSTWISGIEIARSANAGEASTFWPPYTPVASGADDGVCSLSFSPNLNCIIGGRGSGKSALIEALAFATAAKTIGSPEAKSRGRALSEAESRAAATLKGMSVRICWQSLHDPSFAGLEKKVKFVTRYFDAGGEHSGVRVENLSGSEIVAESGSLPQVHLFRFKDIEQAAHPDQLRRMFDALHGTDVGSLSKEIESDIRALRDQRADILSVAADINKLTLDVRSPLREYVRRKKQFDAVNTSEAKIQFEKIDKAAAINRAATDAVTAWERVSEALAMEQGLSEVEEFASGQREKLLKEDGSLREGIEELAKLLDASDPQSPISQLLAAIRDGHSRAVTFREKLAAFATTSAENLKETNDAASKQGIVVVTNAREVNKKSSAEAESDLETYRKLIRRLRQLMGARRAHFDRLRERCIKRSRIRRATATKITQTLASALDRNVLVIRAEAQEKHDVAPFRKWLLGCGGITYGKEAKTEKLLEAKLLPDKLRDALLDWEGTGLGKIAVLDDIAAAAEKKTALELVSALRPFLLEKEMIEEEDVSSFPNEIVDGLIQFQIESPTSKDHFNSILELDEVLIDDRPVILLNDRPTEPGSKLRPLEELSPGQRCSAILPILLATGDGPLIIDQPEDNLDTRLIRQVIVNILANIKLKRQIIMATHNPNIPVLGDAEQTLILRAVADKQCCIDGYGDLGAPFVIHYVTDIMEGGREAFQYRSEIYHPYWTSADA